MLPTLEAIVILAVFTKIAARITTAVLVNTAIVKAFPTLVPSITF